MAPRFSMAIGRFVAIVVVTLRGTVDAAASMGLARQRGPRREPEAGE